MNSLNALQRYDANITVNARASTDVPPLPSQVGRDRVVEALGSFDILTGLATRDLLLTRLENTIKNHRQQRQSFALLVMDIDDFESINSRFGRIAGDEVMRSIAGRLRSKLRGGDIAARYGDDEFAILIEAVSAPTMVLRIVQRLQAVFSQPFFVKGAGIQVSASVGCALYPQDGLESSSVLSGAFEAMGREKARQPQDN